MNEKDIMDAIALVRNRRMTRRTAFQRALTGGAVVAAGMLLPELALPKAAQAQAVTDVDIFNFALNFEYLEAEYYTLGTTGQTIEQLGLATNGAGTSGGIAGGRQVNFTTPAIRQFMEEVAQDERNHVGFVRTTLQGAAIARPAINFTDAFNVAAQAAGIGPTFDPFADEISFLLGGFTFSDVTVTALVGAAPLIQSKDNLEAAAGLLGVEGYHVGGIRLRIFQAGAAAQTNAQKISDLRDTLDGPAADKDQGVTLGNAANLVPADANSIAFARSFSEVLHIAYANPAPGVSQGGFFPSGVNGSIKVAA